MAENTWSGGIFAVRVYRKRDAYLSTILHLNGHTFGFNPQTQYLEPPCTT